MVYSAVLAVCGTDGCVMKPWPEPPPMVVDMSASAASKRLGCHADLYTVSRCHTRGESENHTGKKARKGSTLHGFETQGRCQQKSKTGVSVAPQKGLMSSKKFFKKLV